MFRTRSAVMVLVLGAILSVCCYAQQNGSIAGSVTDTSGAVVPGAKVTAANTATARTQSTVTGSAGTYTITELPPGIYTVTVEKRGFQRSVSSGVFVNVATAANLPIILHVGATTQSVHVTAAPALLQTSTTSTGQIMTSQAILQLPLSLSGGLRDNLEFAALTPGVQWTPGDDLSLRISGGQVVGTSFLLDGTEAQSEQENGPSFQAVSADAVAEFKVQTSSYSAQYGRLGNGIVNLVTKSGANQLHLDAFEYLRNTALDARGFYSATTPIAHQNDYGGTLGGPIYIPHVYNGRNKAFFFFSWEKSDYVAASLPSLISVPSMAERSGDFSDWVTSTGAQIPIYNPSTTAVVNGVVTRQQFPGNIIPASDIVPQAALLTSLLPPPGFSGIEDNELSVGSAGSFQRVYSAQIDLNVTPKDHTQFLFSSQNAIGAPPFGPIPGPLGENFSSNTYSHYYRFNYDHIFSPTLLNHLSMGLNRVINPQIQPTRLSAADRAALSLKGVAYNDPQAEPAYGVGPFGTWGFWVDIKYPQQMVNIDDMITDIHGRHTLQAGFDFITGYFANINCNECAGEADFGAGQTGVPTNANSGSAYASLLLGGAGDGAYEFPSAFSTGENYYAWFFQDGFRATRKLTINMGLRYEIPIPPTERYARQSSFCPSCSNPAAGGIPGAVTFLGVGPGRNGLSSFQETRKDAFGPRLGVAYQLSRNTVLRGGGGIYYYPEREGANSDRGHDGFAGTYSISSPNGYDPAFTLATGFPPTTPPPNLNPGIDLFATPAWFQYQAGLDPYFVTFNGTVEHRFGRSTSLTVSYVGTNGVGLYDDLLNYNQALPKYNVLGNALSLPAGSAAGLAALASVGKSLPWPAFPADESVHQALLPWPQYTGFDIVERGSTAGHSTYNALNVSLSHPFSHGLWAQLSYTYSKMLDNTGGVVSYATGNGFPGPENQYDLAAEKAVDNEDVPQHLVLSYIYNFPVGRGREFLGHAKGITNAVLGDWRISGVQTYQSGWPLPSVGGDELSGVYTGSRANASNVLPLVNPAWNGDPSVPYLNRAAFSSPPNYTLGDSPRLYSYLRDPGLLDEDFSLAKDFPLPGPEGRRITFSANVFNAFNRVQFGGVDEGITDPNFGQVTSQANSPREFQFMLRLQW